MMLATWLVEFYLSKCNELDDIVAAESVSQDVDSLQTEKVILEDDLRQFFKTYKVTEPSELSYFKILISFRTTLTKKPSTNLYKVMVEQTCIFSSLPP